MKKYLFIERPSLLTEWDYLKNKEVSPDKVTCFSNIKRWWICNICKHNWESTPGHRFQNRNCPNCWIKKRKTFIGENTREHSIQKRGSLLEKAPELMQEWDYTKNSINNIHPKNISLGSKLKVFWLCKNCGFSFDQSPNTRVYGHGCPKCNKLYGTSFPEQAIYFYISKVFKNTINGYKDSINGITELDIYIPEIKTAIEYDGGNWHNSEKSFIKEKKKYEACKKNGIRLIRVKEKNLDELEKNCDLTIISLYQGKNGDLSSLDNIIKEICKNLGLSISVDSENDFYKISSQYLTNTINNSLAKKFPEIAQDWDYSSNFPILPTQVAYSSNKTFFWKCSKCRNTWKTSPNSRTNKSHKTACPYCVGRIVQPGKNDLATLFPKLMNIWDFKKNSIINLDPAKLSIKSFKKANWICNVCNGEWQARISDKTKATGCPYCSNRLTKTGVNDLQTKFPELFKEWDKEKNLKTNPKQVSLSISVKYWWKCQKCSFSWETSSGYRIRGKGCPNCSKASSFESKY
jgi:DNA-directed RNA polymerase subunit RPC12/RpoP